MATNTVDRARTDDDVWATVTGYAFLWSAPVVALVTAVFFLRA